MNDKIKETKKKRNQSAGRNQKIKVGFDNNNLLKLSQKKESKIGNKKILKRKIIGLNREKSSGQLST